MAKLGAFDEPGTTGSAACRAQRGATLGTEASRRGRSAFWAGGPGVFRCGSHATKASHPNQPRSAPSRGTVAAFSRGMQTIPNLVTVDLDESRARGVDVSVVAAGLLDALDRTNTRATFFVPRPYAEARPQALRQMVERGHEVACLTSEQPAKARPYCARFSGELDATRDAIEQATGQRVRGHRNAEFAVDYESEWAYDVRVDRGFEYDSSRIPPKYADPRFERVPRSVHVVRRWGGTLMEIPVSTADVLTMRVQLGSTSTIRGLPMPIWSALVEDRRARQESLVIDVRASELRRGSTLERVGLITGKFAFTSVADALPALSRSAPIIES